MDSNLKTRIMRRVYTIWFLRKVTSPRVVKFLILVASVWQFKERVFVAQVFQNMPGLTDVMANIRFFSYALVHTQLAVQLSILVGGILALWLTRDLLKHQRSYWF